MSSLRKTSEGQKMPIFNQNLYPDPEVIAVNSEVKTYFLSPEEIAAKYGPPTKAKSVMQDTPAEEVAKVDMCRLVTKEWLKNELSAGQSLAQIAFKINKNILVVKGLIEKWGLDKVSVAENNLVPQSKTAAVREKLPKEKLVELLKEKKPGEIAKDIGCKPWVITELKRQYGLLETTMQKGKVVQLHDAKCACCAELTAMQKKIDELSARVESIFTPVEMNLEETAIPPYDIAAAIKFIANLIRTNEDFKPQLELTQQDGELLHDLDTIFMWCMEEELQSMDEVLKGHSAELKMMNDLFKKLNDRMAFYTQMVEGHRHQVGAGHWSGRGEL